ncbi:Putative deoxyribonuclease RhsC [Myxococcus stipitatus]
MFGTWTDVVQPGLVPFILSRYYSTALLSQVAQRDVPLGWGWRHGLELSLRQTVDGFAFTDAEGTEFQLDDLQGHWARRGRLVAPSQGVELRAVSEHQALLIRYDDDAAFPFRYLFERKARSASYQLAQILKGAQAFLAFSTDARGLLATVRQSREQREFVFHHDSRRRLVGVSLRGARKELLVEYEYDGQGRLGRVRDRNGIQSVYGYDAAGRMVSESRGSGAIYSFQYDAQGRCIHSSGTEGYQATWLRFDTPRRQTEVLDSHGGSTLYEYNESGQVTRVLSPMGEQLTYQFNEDGRLVATTFPDKSSTRREYDELGRLKATLLQNGQRMELAYDEDHRLSSFVDWDGSSWRFQRDEDGQVVEAHGPMSLLWRYAYNRHGERVSVTNPAGSKRHFDYDAHGNLLHETDWQGAVWRSEYDAEGRRIASTDPLGHTTFFDHDKRGLLTQVRAPDGRTWKFEYDESERLRARIEPGGGRSRFRWNACGQPLEFIDEAGHALTFQWDTEPGRLLEIRNAQGDVYRFDYDKDGRLVKRRAWDGRTFQYEWHQGHVVAMTDPRGLRTAYGLDVLGRVIERRSAEGTTEYEYNARHALCRVTTPWAETLYEYDGLGNIVAESQNGVRLESQHDMMGRRTSLWSERSGHTRFGWDPNGRCTAIERGDEEVTFVHDLVGREVLRRLPGGGEFEQTYDPLGRVLEQVFRDPRAHGLGAVRPDAGGHLRRSFSYDENGQLARIHDSMRGSSFFFHSAVGQLVGVLQQHGVSEVYGHDALENRIKRIELTDAVRSWDEQQAAEPARSLQEWVSNAKDSEKYTYAEGNRLMSVVSRQRRIDCEYDAAGNLIRKTVQSRLQAPETWRYEWNAQGGLAAVIRPDGDTWRYTYDGLGRRIVKAGPTGQTTYVWDGRVLLYEVSPEGKTTLWTHGGDHVALVAWERDDRMEWVLPNAAGTPSELVAADGTWAWVDDAGPWGAASGESTRHFTAGFPGQWYDAESGLHYNLFRYYDPELGRYISPDPLDIQVGFNDYRYVADPYEMSDPLGLIETRVTGPVYRRGTTGLGTTPGGNTRYYYTYTDANGATRSASDDVKRNTYVEVFTGQEGNRQYQFSTINGTPHEDLSVGRSTLNSMPASVTQHIDDHSWWHAEMWAFHQIHQQRASFSGSDPIHIVINRRPCPGHCSVSVPHMAQAMANDLNRPIVVEYTHRGQSYRHQYDPCG